MWRPCDERFRSEIALILKALITLIFVGTAALKLTGKAAPD
jgi:hypothetical protein